MSLIQLLKFKTWETRLFKMPRLETPRLQTRHWVTVDSGHRVICKNCFGGKFNSSVTRIDSAEGKSGRQPLMRPCGRHYYGCPTRLENVSLELSILGHEMSRSSRRLFQIRLSREIADLQKLGICHIRKEHS